LVVGRHRSSPERGIRRSDYLGYRVGLREILRRIAIRRDHASIGLQNGGLRLVVVRKLKLICHQIRARGGIREENLVEHIGIEVVFVRTDARLLVRINRQGDIEELLVVAHGYKRIDVRRVGRVVERDQRSVHMTGCMGRQWANRESECDGSKSGRSDSGVCFHGMCYGLSGGNLLGCDSARGSCAAGQ
jgi:hypothetical protein